MFFPVSYHAGFAFCVKFLLRNPFCIAGSLLPIILIHYCCSPNTEQIEIDDGIIKQKSLLVRYIIDDLASIAFRIDLIFNFISLPCLE
jgi:hypothetical protein